MECWENEEFEFLENATERQILPCEIVFDIDEEPYQEKAERIAEWLTKHHYRYRWFFSGSRGHHIHVINPKYLRFAAHERHEMRSFILKKFGCDPMKASEKMMITIEGAAHRKTGSRKTLIKSTEREYDG